MKKLYYHFVSLLTLIALVNGVNAQTTTRFQASFSYTGNTISFKVKPQATTTTTFSVIEFFVRVPSGAPAFNWGSLNENTTNFPGMGQFAIDPSPPADPGFRVTHFFYTAPEPITTAASYTGGTEYEVFNVTIDVDPATLNMQLVHSPGDEDPYYLALTDGLGQDLRPALETTFFYPTTNTSGDPYFLALATVAPIALKDFNVSKQGNSNALLTWTTTFEQNASYFAIERSVKQSDNWVKIAEVKAKGNSSIDVKYNFTDLNVYDGREVSKTLFYRLKEVDLDGTEKVFPIRSLKFSALGDKEINVFPNPAKNGFYVQIPIILRVDQKVRLSLVNRLGQVVDTREISTAVANNYFFDISSPSITSGDYALDIIYDGQKLATKKILVNR